MHPGSIINIYLLLEVREASDFGVARGGVKCTAADGSGTRRVGRLNQPGLKSV